MQLQRSLLPLANAIFITIVLFALMQSLIGKQEAQIEFPKPLAKLEFTPTKTDTPVKVAESKPKKPDLLSDPPERLKPVIEKEIVDASTDWHEPIIALPPTSVSGPSDGQLVLVLGFPPVYPAKAIARGIEGYAVVGFSVAPSGAVLNPVIIESEPASVFDKASLKAIQRFKYQPKIVAGKAVVSHHQRYQFTYQLDN